MTIDGDAPDHAYEVMRKGAQLIKGIPGLTCEIGVRRGLGSLTIMQACQDNDDKRIHIGIDPWGNIPYSMGENIVTADYTNQMRNEALAGLYEWCYENDQSFIMFTMEDSEFFNRFADGVPVYGTPPKSVINEYAYVYYDGPHNGAAIKAEVEFFEPRTPVGGVWQFDNTNLYQHEYIHKWILGHGFESITDEVGRAGPSEKESYRRVNNEVV